MLQKAIVKVQDAEAKAEEIVRESQRLGQEMIENAKVQAKQLIETATEDARKKAAELLTEAKVQAEAEKSQYASALHQELEQSKQDALAKKQEAVAAIIDGIL